MNELLGLDGKIVVVTGAAKGIGAATASLFTRAGAVTAGCDRADDFIESDDPFRRNFDVRDHDAAAAFVHELVDRHGRIDVLVNNAGGTFAAEFVDVSPKGQSALINENFVQAADFIRLSVPHIPPGGAVVNVTSIEAHRAAPGYAVYAAMKAALTSLTQSLALELAPSGIRVNAMAPDVLSTEGVDIPAGGGPAIGGYSLGSVPPLGRWGDASDGAAAILFLASNLARFITGVTLHVDGGNQAAGGWRRETTPAAGSIPGGVQG